MACAGDPTGADRSLPANLVECAERFPRRPEICTREYIPVCGLREVQRADGATATEWKTYATGCTACSDAGVIGYVEGACPDSD